MGGAWEALKPSEDAETSSSKAAADGGLSIDLFEFVALRMELLHEALAPQAPAEQQQTDGESAGPLLDAAADPDDQMGEEAAASASGTQLQPHLNGGQRNGLCDSGSGSQSPARLSQTDEQPRVTIPAPTEMQAAPTPMDTSHDESETAELALR